MCNTSLNPETVAETGAVVPLASPTSSAISTAPSAIGPPRARLCARLLLVDDNADMLTLLAHLLHEGPFIIETAQSGPEALQKYQAAQLSAEPFTLVLLDLAMPSMSGFEVIEAIRAGGDATTTIAVLTAAADDLTTFRAAMSQVSAIWQKPRDVQGLRAKISALLGLGDG